MTREEKVLKGFFPIHIDEIDFSKVWQVVNCSVVI